MKETFKREILVNYSIQEGSYTIGYYLHGDKATIQFVVRCPTEHWNYYLPIDLGHHADVAQYEEQSPLKCQHRSSGNCYYDGTTLGAQELWEHFKETGDEEVIWIKLTQWYNERFL